MEQSLMENAAEQGIWTLLFISLYFYQLREAKRRETESQAREEKLAAFIHDISKQFEGLVKQYERIAEDVQAIKIGLDGSKFPAKQETGRRTS